MITCDFWLTHWIGSVCSSSLPSTSAPPAKITTLATASTTASFAGTLPSQTTSRPSGPSRKSLRLVGDLYSRMPRIESVDTMLLTQIAATPTASSSPNWRIIGTLANRSAAKAKIASNVTTSSAGPRLRAVSWIGCSARSMTTSSSTRACIWIA